MTGSRRTSAAHVEPQSSLTMPCRRANSCRSSTSPPRLPPGVEVPTEVYSLLNAATFATLTNVNFDDARFKVRGGAGVDAGV